MFHRLLFSVAFILSFFISKAQYSQPYERSQYVGFQTGLLFDTPNNNVKVRLLLEYLEEINSKWQYGITNDYSYFLTAPNDGSGGAFNVNYLTANLYTKIKLSGNSWFWRVGIGTGIMLANGSVKPVVSITATTNIRLSDRIYLELPFFIFLPSDRVYLSPPIDDNSSYYASFSFAPIGLKFKL